jgi:hypothetical protein
VVATQGLAKDKVPVRPYEKAVQWVDIHVPQFPPLAQQARVRDTVAIELRFKGCDLDPESPHVLGGHPMLAAAALQALKQSTTKVGRLS